MDKKVLIISSLFVSVGILCAAQDSNDASATSVKAPVAVNVEQSQITDKAAALTSEKKVVAEGTISDIAADGASITVDTGKETIKFITTKDFIDEAYMETGDKVKITGEKTDVGIKLVDYDYIFDESYETGDGEPEPAAKVKPLAEEVPAAQPAAASVPAQTPAPEATDAVDSNAAAAPAPAVAPVSVPAAVTAPQAAPTDAPAVTGNSAQ